MHVSYTYHHVSSYYEKVLRTREEGTKDGKQRNKRRETEEQRTGNRGTKDGKQRNKGHETEEQRTGNRGTKDGKQRNKGR